MPNTPFINMALPVAGVTPGGGSGTSWAPMLTASIELIDAHDHSPGKGAPIKASPAGFQVVADLDMGGHSLYDLQNITMSGTLSVQFLSGSLTQFIPSGSTFPLAAFVGLGGIQVMTNSLGQVIISGSFPEVSDITGMGGTVVSSTGSIWQISSSAPQISNLQGVGGTTVSNVGSLYQVSSAMPPWTNIQGVQNVGIGIVGATVYVSGSAPVFVNALSSFAPTTSRQTVFTDGYAASSDGGGGLFAWSSTSTATVDGGTVVAVTGITTGRWIRVFSGHLDVKWFGATGNGSTDDTAALKSTATAASRINGTVFFSPGTYVVASSGLSFASTVKVEFDQGAILSPSHENVVINGPIDAHLTTQIFGGTGVLSSVTQTSGSGPTITVSGNPLAAWTYALEVASGIVGVNITNNGNYLTTANAIVPPEITFSSSPAGVLGTAIGAPIMGGTNGAQVEGILITYPGFGYVTPPTISFSGFAGSIAATGSVYIADGSGSILTSIVVDSTINGYITQPTCIISGGGANAQAQAIAYINPLSPGAVTEIKIITPGYGYTSTPNLLLNGTVIDPSHVTFVTASIPQFQVALNGAVGFSALPLSGSTYAVPGTGVIVGFSTGSTYTLGNTYTWSSQTPVTLGSNSAEFISAKWWGAVGLNGVSNDDTAALQSAINAATTTGAKLILPAGNYGVTGLTTPPGQFALRIEGAGPSSLEALNNVAKIRNFPSAAGSYNLLEIGTHVQVAGGAPIGTEISNLYFRGFGPNFPQDGIRIKNCQNIAVKNITGQGLNRALVAVDSFSNWAISYDIDNIFSVDNGYAVLIDGNIGADEAGIEIHQVNSTNDGTAFRAVNTSAISIRDCTLQSSQAYNVELVSANATMENCHLEGAGQTNILAVTTTLLGSTIEGSFLILNGSAASDTTVDSNSRIWVDQSTVGQFTGEPWYLGKQSDSTQWGVQVPGVENGTYQFGQRIRDSNDIVWTTVIAGTPLGGGGFMPEDGRAVIDVVATTLTSNKTILWSPPENFLVESVVFVVTQSWSGSAGDQFIQFGYGGTGGQEFINATQGGVTNLANHTVLDALHNVSGVLYFASSSSKVYMPATTPLTVPGSTSGFALNLNTGSIGWTQGAGKLIIKGTRLP